MLDLQTAKIFQHVLATGRLDHGKNQLTHVFASLDFKTPLLQFKAQQTQITSTASQFWLLHVTEAQALLTSSMNVLDKALAVHITSVLGPAHTPQHSIIVSALM